MEPGGSTKPWRVFAISADASLLQVEAPYVVKLFSVENVKQQPCIAKEFICNFLAGEFDLQVPDVGMIDLNGTIFQQTLDPEIKEEYAGKHKGLTFASRLVDGTLINDQQKNNIKSIYEYATVFAFDCLIMNIDRGGERSKSNLLIDDDDFILIDHELSLYFIDDENNKSYDLLISNFNKGIINYGYEKHLFYKALKNFKGAKEGLFDAFEESLKYLNIKKLEKLISDLKAGNIDTRSSDLLIDYLCILKKNPGNFRRILLSIIS